MSEITIVDLSRATLPLPVCKRRRPIPPIKREIRKSTPPQSATTNPIFNQAGSLRFEGRSLQCCKSKSHCPASRIRIHPGSETRRSAKYPSRSRRVSPRPSSRDVAHASRPPKATVAPTRCRRSARLCSSGRMAASTSVTRLPDHVDHDQHDREGCHGPEQKTSPCSVESDELGARTRFGGGDQRPRLP